MKIKNSLWAFLALLVLAVGISCQSTAEPAPLTTSAPASTPAQTVTENDSASPNQAALDELNRAAARAEAARKLVMDFEGPESFPADWQAADSLYTQAEQQKNTASAKDVQESTDRYNQAADALETLAGKTLAAAYEYAETELTWARNEAIFAGAGELVPDYLLDADNTVAGAEAEYQAKNYYEARDAVIDAFFMYTVLKAGLDAWAVRGQIADREFESFDPAHLNQADNLLRSAAGNYEAGDFAAAKDKAGEALIRYELTFNAARRSYASGKGSSAEAERQRALDARANVAVRQEFNDAQAVYTRANAAMQRLDYEEAAALYDDSGFAFARATRAALEKRHTAEIALEMANQRMAESDETARNAELLLEGGME